MKKSGVMICGHGSRHTDAVREFEELVRALSEQFPDLRVRHGFLEFAEPDIPMGLNELRTENIDTILAIPAMLFAAGHVKKDIPEILDAFIKDHHGVTIQLSRELGPDPKLVHAAKARIEESLELATADIPWAETALLVVGRGTKDDAVNNLVKDISQTLGRALRAGHARVCYAGSAAPSLEEGLNEAAGLGVRRVIVFPYLLNTGALVQKIYTATDQAARNHTSIEFLKAPYLGNHPDVIDTFAARIRELL